MSTQQIPGTFFENAPQIIKTDVNYTLGLLDGVVNVDAAGVTVTLPPQPRIGDRHVISANAGDVSVSGGANPIVGGAVVVSNGTSVQYVFNSLGQWEALTGPFGAFGQGEIIVPNIAALAALPAASLPNHVYARPLTVDQAFELEKTDAQTPDGITIVAAVGGGNWLRILSPVPRWTEQLVWFVNPLSGNDENDGATAATALKTVAEFARRLTVANFDNYVVNLLGDIPANDILRFSPWQFTQIPEPSNALNANFLFKGVRTPVVTSTVSAATLSNPVAAQNANSQATITDPTVVWANQIGNLIVTSTGAIAWILKDLGGGTARVSNWWSVSGLASVAAPAAGSTYTINTLTKWASTVTTAGKQGRFHLNWTDVEFTGVFNVEDQDNDLTTTKHSNGIASFRFFAQTRPNVNGALVTSPAGAPTNTDPAFVPGAWRLMGCAFIGIELQCHKLGRAEFLDCVIQSGNLIMGAPAGGSPAPDPVATSTEVGQIDINGTILGGVFIGGLGIFDAPAGKNGLLVRKGGNCAMIGPLYGFGNTLWGAQVRERGYMLVRGKPGDAVIVTPSITGTLGEILFENGSLTGMGPPTFNAIPALVPGAPVPAAAPMTMWAQWDAAPFNRNVMSYVSGSAISDFTFP